MLDLHAHILPRFDDGAQDAETSLLMAKLAAKDGITDLVATPHIVPGLHQSTKEEIVEAVNNLNQTLKENGFPIQILPGGEYRLEPELPRKLSAGEIVTVNETGRYILIEFPTTFIPGFTDTVLYELQLQGVTPIIAHPERNSGFVREPKRLEEMVKRGMLSQVTAGSLTGMFGREAQKAALLFLEKGWCHIIASDAHSANGRIPMLSCAAQMVEDYMGRDAALLLVLENPRRIIEAREIVSIEPLRTSLKDKFLHRILRRKHTS